MKTDEVPSMEEARATFLAAQTKEQTGAVSLCLLLLTVTFILPHFVSSPFRQIVMGVGAAVGFSAYYFLFSESLRSRSGSLKPALCLLVFVWLCAAVGIVFALT